MDEVRGVQQSIIEPFHHITNANLAGRAGTSKSPGISSCSPSRLQSTRQERDGPNVLATLYSQSSHTQREDPYLVLEWPNPPLLQL